MVWCDAEVEGLIILRGWGSSFIYGRQGVAHLRGKGCALHKQLTLLVISIHMWGPIQERTHSTILATNAAHTRTAQGFPGGDRISKYINITREIPGILA